MAGAWLKNHPVYLHTHEYNVCKGDLATWVRLSEMTKNWLENTFSTS